MLIRNPLKCIIYWAMLVVMMVLHFNYHVGDIFYDIDVVRPNANGVVPMATHGIRNIFYHLPMVWILLLLASQANGLKLGLFLISLVYAFAHAMHLFKELATPDFSQIPLLTLAFLVSLLLSFEHFRYWRDRSQTGEHRLIDG